MSHTRWATLALLSGLAACSANTDPGDGSARAVARGQLALIFELPTDVTALIEVRAQDGEAVSRHADRGTEQVFTLLPGAYTVRLSPMRDGEALPGCEPAQESVWVDAASTTQVWLVANCSADDFGTLVVGGAVNYAPLFEQLQFAPDRGGVTCEPTTLKATAVDPEGDAIEYHWEPSAAAEAALAESEVREYSFSATFREPGSYPVVVRACDEHGACTDLDAEFHVSLGDTSCAWPAASAWRIRNASAPSANAWALRGLRFCTDPQCAGFVSGEVFDDGSSRSWSRPESLFDDDPGNFWKAFAAPRVGEAYVGLELAEPTAIRAVAIRPDNVVYGVASVWVEYLDDHTGEWTVHSLLSDVPRHYGEIGSGGPRYPNDVWYVAALEEPGE